MGNALELAPEKLDISVRIFMTGRARMPDQTPLMSDNDDDGNSSLDEMMTPTMEMRRPLMSFAAVQLTHGRPELGKLLKDEVSATVGRISVTGECRVRDMPARNTDAPSVCGSQAIAKACRDALRMPFSHSLYGGPSIVLHVESFGYA